MAKFCIKCGNPLVEGVPCSCSISEKVHREPSTPPPAPEDPKLFQKNVNVDATKGGDRVGHGQPYTVPTPPPPAVGDAGAYAEHSHVYRNEVDYAVKAKEAKEVLYTGYSKASNIWLKLFKQPYTEGIAFSTSDDVKSASMVIGIHGLLTALFTALFFSVMNDVMEVLNLFIGELVGYMDLMSLEFPLVKIFLFALVGSLVFSALYAGALLLASIVFKNNVSYKTMVCTMASRSAIIIPVIGLSILLMFINAFLGMAFFALGNLAGVAYMTMVFPVTKIELKNYVPLIVFLGTVLFLLGSVLILRNSYTLFLPSELKELLPYLEEFMKVPGGLHLW